MNEKPSADDAERLEGTDLFDVQNKCIKSGIFPNWLLATLFLLGIVAFAVTGFLGNNGNPAYQGIGHYLFDKPTALFLWLCLLIVTIEWAKLRVEKLLRHRISTIAITVLSIALVAAIDLNLIHLKFSGFGFLHTIFTNIVTYLLLNYGLLGLFLVDSIRRWILRILKRPLTLDILRLFDSQSVQNDPPPPDLGELVTGDTITLGLFALVFSFFFTPNLLGVFGVGQSCEATLFKYGPCIMPKGNGIAVLGSSMSTPDLTIAFIALFIGLATLAIAALISAIQKGGSTREVVREVWLTFRAALYLRVRIGLKYLVQAMRQPVWWAMIFAGVAGAAVASDTIQLHLQAISADPGCHDLQSIVGCLSKAHTSGLFQSPAATSGIINISSLSDLVLFAIALGSVIAVAIAITCAVALLVMNVHFAGDSLRFIWQAIQDFAVSFWIFSLALSVLNGLIWLIAQISSTSSSSVRWPFPQLGLFTAVSFILFLVVGIRKPPEAGVGLPQRIISTNPLIGPLTQKRRSVEHQPDEQTGSSRDPEGRA